MVTSESQLQIMAYHLKLMARKFKMNISNFKTKSMSMYRNHITRAMNDNPIGQVSDFKYMGYLL